MMTADIVAAQQLWAALIFLWAAATENLYGRKRFRAPSKKPPGDAVPGGRFRTGVGGSFLPFLSPLARCGTLERSMSCADFTEGR